MDPDNGNALPRSPVHLSPQQLVWKVVRTLPHHTTLLFHQIKKVISSVQVYKKFVSLSGVILYVGGIIRV